MTETKVSIRDLDLQVRVRSSKMSSTELHKITTLVVDTLLAAGALDLVEQNTIVNRTAEKTLVTITTTFLSAQ